MSKKYTNEELFYIYNTYVNCHKTTTEIAKEINRSQSGVESALKRMGVNVSLIAKQMRLAIPVSEHNNICKLYLDGYTTEEIANIYNVVDNTIAQILKRNNIKLRKAVRRSIIQNHDIFNKIDTQEKAYWLGWLITDGSVFKYKNERKNRSELISLELQEGDKYIVENFAIFLGATKDKVKISSNSSTAYFRFSSKIMAEDLKQYGVIPNKTGKQILPIIDKQLMPFLIRGIFEGNGSVYITNNKLRTAFYGSKDLITDIAKLLNKENIYTIHKIIDRGIISSYHISAMEASYKLFKYMYNNIDNKNMICKRKYDKFLNFYN